MDLARCDYVDRRENIIALGPSGTGKTHIALGLGLAACQRGLKVRFTTAAALVHDLIVNERLTVGEPSSHPQRQRDRRVLAQILCHLCVPPIPGE